MASIRDMRLWVRTGATGGYCKRELLKVIMAVGGKTYIYGFGPVFGTKLSHRGRNSMENHTVKGNIVIRRQK